MKKVLEKFSGIAILTALFLVMGVFVSDHVHAQQFTDNGDGTVTDNKTGLMWTQNANPFGRLDWNSALLRCSSYSIAEHSGWRLPTLYELMSLSEVIKEKSHPFMNIQSSYYWSGSSPTEGSDFAWRVSVRFASARSFNKSLSYHVWPVRDPD